MKLRVPDYFYEFSCIADRCKDSCCIGWEIDIDDDTYDYYNSIPGDFGRRLKKEMYVTPEGDHSFRLAQKKRCPFLNSCNLCDIYTELGEEALSEVCTEYPRFAIEYGDVLQKCLSLSCEEVGRLVFTRETPVEILENDITADIPGLTEETMDEQEIPEADIEEAEECISDSEKSEAYDFGSEEVGSAEQAETEWEYEEETDPEEEQAHIAFMEQLQEKAITLLQNRRLPLQMRMEQYFSLFTEEADDEFSGLAVQTPFELFNDRLQPFLEMEVLDREWRQEKKALQTSYTADTYESMLQAYCSSEDYRETDYEQLLVYFTFRYLLNAVYDYDAQSYAKLALVFTLLIRDMDALRFSEKDGHFDRADRIDTVRIFSKEVEHSQDNIDLAKEAFLFDEIFSTEKILEQIRFW